VTAALPPKRRGMSEAQRAAIEAEADRQYELNPPPPMSAEQGAQLRRLLPPPGDWERPRRKPQADGRVRGRYAVSTLSFHKHYRRLTANR
jgi:hypothetical protein